SDEAGVKAHSDIASISSTSNLGGVDLLQDALDNLDKDYDFTTASGEVVIGLPNYDFSSGGGSVEIDQGDVIKIEYGYHDLISDDFNTTDDGVDNIDVDTGEIVWVDDGYGAEDFDTNDNTAVAIGDVVMALEVGDEFGKRFVSKTALAKAALSVHDYGDTAKWTEIGGTVGSAYVYVDSDDTLNLTRQNYNDTSLWREITGDEGAVYQFLGNNDTTLDLGTQNYADTAVWTKRGASDSTKVRVGTDYATEDHTTDDTGVLKGEVVKVVGDLTGTGGQGVDGQFYKYIGAADLSATVLNTVDYTDGTNWASADAGDVYRYVGSAAVATPLGEVDYEGSSDWEKVTESTADYIPNIGNVTGSDSVAIGGLVIRNDVRSDVDALIDNTDVEAGGNVVVSALSNAQIEVTLLSQVSSSGGSAFGTGTSLAINATIATNLVQSDTSAKITNSEIGDDSIAIGGNVSVTADNTSGIDATI
ncbi:MAG: hypothetical protein GY708_01390, partial [Actinomycetia bacterium]|nr:hypothetical protein [Actinomycetes bacterium]